MNNADKQYLDLASQILKYGRPRKSRAGDTFGIFGAQLRFNLQEGFPLLTTKRVHFHSVFHELLWFLSGSTNIKYLVDNGVNIWNDDAYRNFKSKYGQTILEAARSTPGSTCPTGSDIMLMTNKDCYIRRILTDSEFAKKWGELGEGTYGSMWREFPTFKASESIDQEEWQGEKIAVDQIDKLIQGLKHNPDSRRHIVNAWHPYWVDKCVLPPCHTLFQFHTEELSHKERMNIVYTDLRYREYATGVRLLIPDTAEDYDRLGVPKRRLSCQLYQRSCDVPLGGPYNIASYALLTHLVAQSVDMVVGDFVWSLGDAHIYTNQIEGIKEQLSREPRALPKLVLNSSIKNIFGFKAEDIKIEDYNPHPAIKIPLSVG